MAVRDRLVELGCRCADSGTVIVLPDGTKMRVIPGLMIDGRGVTCVGCGRTTSIMPAEWAELGFA
jgi:ribosomal protein S27E